MPHLFVVLLATTTPTPASSTGGGGAGFWSNGWAVTIGGTVIGGLLLAGVLWLLRRTPVAARAGTEAARQAAGIPAQRRAKKQEQHRQRLIRDVIERSKAINQPVLVECSGGGWFGPAYDATNSLGQHLTYIPDFRSYEQMTSPGGRYSPLTTFWCEPPKVVGCWTVGELEAWLEKHRTTPPSQ